ncbi:hypothetical protein BU17DRAFT_78625 [Hysterangium stoloniferum]|nr:hypothetical protein BU17DRAFT_78625 [Hysterangium stoloniferum]
MPAATSSLMDSITSSPIAPPRDINRLTATSSRTLSLELFSSPAPAPGHCRKQLVEDYTQFTKGTSQRFKLCKTDAAELQDFAKYNIVEQNIVIAAGMLKMREQQEAMNPPDLLYIIPKKLALKIDALTFSILLNPSLNAYLEHPKDPKAGPMPILMLTESMGCPDPNNPVKQIDALTLTELCYAISTIYGRENLSFSPQLCARIAFLTEEGGALRKFWAMVDNELASAHKMSNTKASKYFAAIILKDCSRFGGSQDELNIFIEDSIQDGTGGNREASNSTDDGENENNPKV